MRLSLALIALVALFVLAAPVSATILRVGEFGAQGNGGADDTAALQSAFDALENGDELHFDADKIYTISRSLVLSDKSGYRVVGNNATIRMMDGVPATKSDPNFLLLIKNNHDFSWENLTIDGNRANRPGPAPESGDQAWYHNIIISGGSDFKFEQVQSNHSYQDGFYIAAPDAQDPSSFPRGAQFIECNALHNWRQGMSIINAYDVRVSGGSYSFTHGDWPMAGIDIEPNKRSAVPGVKGVAIQGVRFEANKGFGVAAVSARPEDILIEHSYFRANARGGVRIGGANMTVQNNLFEDFNTAITYKAYGHFSTETRGIVDIVAGGGENQNARVIGNTFRSISVGSSIVYVHRIAGDGAEITDNCFEQFTVPAILSHKSSSVQIARNEMNPPSGCRDPRKKTTEQPSDSPR